MAFSDVIKFVEGVFSKDAFKQFAAEATTKLEKIKEKMLLDVIAHPVSIELEKIPSPSSFLESSKGSLFGFLGFNADQNPVQDLIDYLDRVMIIRTSRASLYNRLGGTYARLYIPDKKDMRKEDVLKIPAPHGEGRSWPEWVENGMAGLDKYVGKPPLGRSSEGYQAKNIVRQGQFKGTPYLTAIFAKFRRQVKNIK